MTPAELMALADAYAAALANYYRNCGNYGHVETARAALAEALEMTSQFGGLA